MMDDATETDAPGDAYELNAATVDGILAAVELGARERLVELLEPLHEADIADLLEQIPTEDRHKLLDVWGADLDGAFLSELEEGVRDDIVAYLDDKVLAEAVSEMETDDVVYLVEDLEEDQQERVLEALDDADRVAVEASLQYEEGTAGRLMSREMVLAPAHWNVGEAIDYMRAHDDLPDNFYKVILVDPRMKVAGTVPLGKIMSHPRTVPLEVLADKEPRLIPVDQTYADVAYAFNQYHMISAPVVDGDERVVGVITMDDAMDVLEDEAEEDMNFISSS
ncbi:MAG: CBS domain-containing protein, partial [Pseudomonadota bacterium]